MHNKTRNTLIIKILCVYVKIESKILTEYCFLQSCEKSEEHTLEDFDSITEEIEKIETTYKEGDIKIETVWKKGDIKTETTASDKFIEQIQLELDESYESYSKQRIYRKSNAGGTVGVFKYGTCGSYRELLIHMDCEDSRNNSSVSGNIGDSQKDNRGNIKLRFCVVQNDLFREVSYGYAILNLATNQTTRIKVGRYFDNEDSSNRNSTRYNGSSFNGWFGQSHMGGRNTTLTFDYYPPSSVNTSFPNIGISYGVLGKVTNAISRGAIHTDDEDSDNVNWCEKRIGSSTNRVYGRVNVYNLMRVGIDTDLYLSKVR